MAQVTGIPYRRHGPSAALQEFLDPLDPGDYFDCGRARLHGLDDALLDEARSRGREVGDDDFLLVATDAGLYFCRPSISFAISARWDEVTLTRPRGADPVLLPVTWPRHGELKFTVSKRLAGNIFRRWLQLRMHADRKKRQTGQHPLVVPADPSPEIDVRAEVPTRVAGALGRGGGPVDRSFDDISDLLSDEVDTDPPFPLRPAGGAHDATATATGTTGSALSSGDDVDERVDTVDPKPAQTSDGLPFVEPTDARSVTGTLADEQLERVTVPRTTTAPSSWVGSAVSLAASLVVISTVVLIATVSVSVWRGASGAPPIAVAAGGGEGAAAAPPATIDHERFREPTDQDGLSGPDLAAGASMLDPSSAGGASQSIPSSSQQLLAVPTDGPVGASRSGLDSDADADAGSAGDPEAALRCSSNYSGCVPDVADTAGADVDCLGDGDGPFFAEAEVMVLGEDIYGLDSDGDRVACEADQLDGGPLSTGSPIGAGRG